MCGGGNGWGTLLEDRVAFFEVAGAELEGVGALEVVGGVVGAVGRDGGGLDVSSYGLDLGECRGRRWGGGMIGYRIGV